MAPNAVDLLDPLSDTPIETGRAGDTMNIDCATVVLDPPRADQPSVTIEHQADEIAPTAPSPAPAPAAAKSSRRYQSLDAWRGAACLMLLFYHATFYADLTFRVSQPDTWTLLGLPLNIVRKCWVGVPIFFVISGFCISASVDSLRRRNASLKTYFVRRFRRIYPPLWIMCGIAAAYTFAARSVPVVAEHCDQLPNLMQFSIWEWFGNFAAAESWRHNMIGGKPNYLMGNTWTLCYEEQFYLAAGLLLAVSSRRFFAGAAVLTAAVLVGRHVMRAAGWTSVGFFWDGHWIMFAAGILVYHSLNYQSARQRCWTWIALAVLLVYGGVDRFITHDSVERHLSEYVFTAAAFGMALLVLRRWDDRIANHWLAWPLNWCGKRSYSIYLTHYPLVVTLSALMALAGFRSEFDVATIVVPLSVALSIPFAILFYWGVERHFLNPPMRARATSAAEAD